jgi:hypothetical protein
MSFVSGLRLGPAQQRDRFDQVLAVAWIASEITFDVLGPFFWAALALFYLKAIS